LAETVALIDYGAGNLHSVHNALRVAGAERIVIAGTADAVAAADRIVLPGVGAFGAAMDRLRAIPDMVETLEARVLAAATPFLGVCVGMQLMAATGAEHGETPGLGWLGGRVAALPVAAVKVPHMGWNDVRPVAPHPMLAAGEAYFLHGFAYAGPGVLAETDHGGPVAAAIGRDNLIGVQFHPEKSQRYGLALLARFLEWRP
jgi:glutamine amidotransferase